jgi:hypothetical protein
MQVNDQSAASFVLKRLTNGLFRESVGHPASSWQITTQARDGTLIPDITISSAASLVFVEGKVEEPLTEAQVNDYLARLEQRRKSCEEKGLTLERLD